MTSKDPVGNFPSRQSPRQKFNELNQSEDNGASYKPVEKIDSAMLIRNSSPTVEEWNAIAPATKTGVALTGSIALRPAEPVIGLLDIGSSDDAYFFMMSLPGVSRDAGNLNCTIERNGKVLVEGVNLTGQRKVCKGSRIFEMQTPNLCPPGPFSISFQLPGPVEPTGFIGDFLDIGIFEAIVLRQDQQDPTEVKVEDNASPPVK